ncbi:MAG TPA: hypothetical protein VGN26_09855 [Armatimonadota bacterium]|jgi:hypothetical protein
MRQPDPKANPVWQLYLMWGTYAFALIIYTVIAYAFKPAQPSKLPPALLQNAALLGVVLGLSCWTASQTLGSAIAGKPAGVSDLASQLAPLKNAVTLMAVLAEAPALLGLVFRLLGLPFGGYLVFAGASLLVHLSGLNWLLRRLKAGSLGRRVVGS